MRKRPRFSQVDVDGNGFVEWEEFCVLMYRKVCNTYGVSESIPDVQKGS